MNTARYHVQRSSYDASRPWRVCAPQGVSPCVVGDYADRTYALRRAAEKNRDTGR